MTDRDRSSDQRHRGLPESMRGGGTGGAFYTIADYKGGDVRDRREREAIDQQLLPAGKQATLFAYPYGHASDYLRNEYLPRYRQEHGMTGAYTTEQGFIEADTPVFALPRMVCGDAWNSTEQFRALLQRLKN